jgi:hypothetical protein
MILSYSIWPRLARPDSLVGERETTSASSRCSGRRGKAVVLLRPPVLEANHVYERNDLNLAVRSTNTNIRST